MKIKLLIYSILIQLLLPELMAKDQPHLQWNGFLSIGGGKTLSEDEIFPADPPSNGLYKNDCTMKPDTQFGLQLKTSFHNGLGATVQILSRGGDDFDLKLEWAYVNYNFSDALTLTVGRKRIPLYYYSDFLDLGYAYHWIRPPGEVYSEALTSYEGGSLLYQSNIQSLNSQLEIWVGNSDAPATPALTAFIGEITMDLKDIIGASWQIGWEEWVKFRLSALKTSIDFLGPADEIIIPDNDVLFWGGAIEINISSLTMVGEFTDVTVDKLYNNRKSWYLSLAYNIGLFTPHITYSELREEGSGALQQEQIIFGVRYDFHDQAAFKIEYSNLKDKSDEVNSLNTFGDSELVTTAIDLIF